MARPTKFRGALAAQIVRNLHNGAYLETAAAAAGIHRDTLHDWLRAGRQLADRAEEARDALDALRERHPEGAPRPKKVARLIGEYETIAAAAAVVTWALAKDAGVADPPVPNLATFSDAVTRAQASAELRDVQIIGAAGQPRVVAARCPSCRKVGHCERCGDRLEHVLPGEWQASAWRLERKFGKRYGARQRIDLQSVDDEELGEILTAAATAVDEAVSEAGLSPEQRERVLALVREKWSALADDGQADGGPPA